MNTTTLQTFNLRGMDERWIVDPQDALYIQDMFWTSNDSWRTSGGFSQVFEPTPITIEEDGSQPVAGNEETSSEAVTFDLYSTINSIHWFAQHNGARQWLIYEEQNYKYNADTGTVIPDGTLTLNVFDGSKSKPHSLDPLTEKPFRTLRQHRKPNQDYSGNALTKITDRFDQQLSVRTQSQTYAGRIYLVNGSDEALVFDGDYCERAGFVSRPPSPTGNPTEFGDSTNYVMAQGDPDAKAKADETKDFSAALDADIEMEGPKKSRGFYTLHRGFPYWGLGSYSDAEIGAGGYRFKPTSPSTPLHSLHENNVGLRLNYYSLEQLNTRRCGFQYRVTYVNERGQESEPSLASGIVFVDNGRGNPDKTRHGKGMIGLQIPIGPKECVARRIYRTRNVYDSTGNLYSKGDQRSFYFLSEIQDNMNTMFIDGHPDTALGPLLDVESLGNFPARTKFLAVFKNTMFASGEELNEVRYSAPLFPESFPINNILSVGDDDGGPITGMRATKNALVVFKNRGIYLIKGDPANGFFTQTLNKDIGCIAPDSITELPSLGLVFLSNRSIYLLEGALENTGSITGVVNLGTEIPNQLERINSSAAIRASAAVYQRDKEYWLSIPIDGSSKNNMCLIYHYEVGSWSVRPNFPIDCMVTSKDHRGYLFFGSNDAENSNQAGLLVYSRGYDTKGSESVLPKYETVSNDYQSVFSTFRPAYVMPYVVGYGNNNISVNYRVNRSINESRAVGQKSDQQDPNESYPVYGEAVFDKDTWVSYRPTVLRYDISTTDKGPVRELSVSFSGSDGNKIEIIGYDIEAKVGEQRNIKPLNKALRSSRR